LILDKTFYLLNEPRFVEETGTFLYIYFAISKYSSGLVRKLFLTFQEFE